MARGIQNYPNIVAPGGDYPNGRSKDNPGDNTGTPVKELTIGDYQQFFAKLMREASIVPNNLPDNEANTYQYFDALQKAAVPYNSYAAKMTQVGGAAPAVTVLPGNTIGAIVWTRSSAGVYIGDLTGAFTANKLFLMVNKVSSANDYAIFSLNINTVVLHTTVGGVLTDGLLVDSCVEIRVYRN